MTAEPAQHPGRPAVVLLGNTDFDANPIAARPLATALAAHTTVLWVDPPVSPLTTLRRPELRPSLRGPRLRVAAPGIVRLTPLVLPGKDRRGVTVTTDHLLRRAIRRAVDRLHLDVRALITTAPNRYPFGAARERCAVYWVQDDYAIDPDLIGIDAEILRRGQGELAQTADLVLVASPHLVETFTPLSRTEPVLFPNACEVPAEVGPDGPRPADLEVEGPYAVYVGRLGTRVELDLLRAVADAGVPLVLVGPRDDGWGGEAFDALVARPQVQWLGERPAAELPAYLAGARVGLVPYADRPFNRASFPLKVLEYLAVGLPVVSTDLPAMAWFPARSVATATDAEYGRAVASTTRVPVDRRAAADRRAFAAEHTWANRASELLARVSAS